MSLNIGELVGYIKLDHSGVGKGVVAAQREMHQGMDRLTRDAKTQGQRAGKEAGDGMAGAFKGSVGKLTGLVVGAFAVEKVVSGLRATKDAASDLNETTSMANQIFGANTKAMEAFAKTGPRALGLSTEATLRQSAAFADMLLQIGYTENGAASASKTIVQMAADLGSFKNLKTEDVLERISAGFRGEYDSLQLLIPNISAARVQSEAMVATGKKNADSLTAQEKAAATLAIVQKDGARAMGDFARTANGEANASKTAAAATEDLKAKIGQGLLPAYTAMVVFGRDQVIPFLSSTVDKLGDAADATKPLAHGIGDLVGEFRALPEPIQTATLGLIAMVALRSRVEAFGDGIQTRVTNTAKGASAVVEALRLHMMYAGDAASTAGNRFTAAGKAIGYAGGVGLRGAASGLLGLLGGPWGVAFIAATTVLGAWMKKQQEAKAFTDDLKASLDQQTGAVTENTRVKLAQKLQDEGLLDVASKLGVSTRDLTDAAAGNADKLRELRDRQQELANVGLVEKLDSTSASLLAGSGAADVFGKGMSDAGRSTAGQAADLQRIIDVIAPLNATMNSQAEQTRDVAAAAGVNTDAQSDMRDQTKITTGALDEQKDTVEELAQKVLDLADAQMSSVDAEIAYQDALDGVGERLSKRKELEAELAKAGGVSDRTKKLQSSLGDETDPKKRAKLEKDLAESRSKDAKKQTEEQARIRKELEDYALTLDLTTKAGRDNQSALNDLAETAKRKAESDAKAGGSLKDLRSNMAEAREDFIDNAKRFGLSQKAAEKMADKFGITKGYVDNLAKSVDDLPASKQIKIEAETAAAATALALLKRQLAGLKDKNVVVTTYGRFVSSEPSKGGGRVTAGGITEADGGVVKYYADGAHVAQHVPAGSWRVFGEPETGGETYIPHAPSKRSRSTAILAETADMFGYGLVPKSVNNTTTNNSPISIGTLVSSDVADFERQMRDRRRRKALGRRRA